MDIMTLFSRFPMRSRSALHSRLPALFLLLLAPGLSACGEEALPPPDAPEAAGEVDPATEAAMGMEAARAVPAPELPHPDMVDASDPLAPQQEAFWARIVDRCGEAYPGEVVDHTPFYASAAAYGEVVAHIIECSPERIHMALHMDDDRSRNWILTRDRGTLLLKHDHRNPDGTEEEITQYGGHAPSPGLSHRQIFPADEHTAGILPERWDNFWFMDFMDDETFAYGVHWPEQGHSIRIHFDLTTPVEPPPAPWGY